MASTGIDWKKRIMEALNAVEGETGKAMQAGSEEAAKIVAQEIRNKALALWPNSKTGYPKNWTYKKDEKTGGYVIYNKKTYQLAHLLNNGHRIIANGKYIGNTKAQPHILSQEEVDKITYACVMKRIEDMNL